MSIPLLAILLFVVLNSSSCLWVSRTTSGTQDYPLIRPIRSLNCSKSEYRPRGRDYCCNRCTRGHHIKADCTGPYRRTLCSECLPGTFLAYENALSKCKSCTVCDSVMNQVEQKGCEPHLDRMCGCPEGTFKSFIDSNTFSCNNCTRCQNDVLQHCTETSDSICRCEPKFFLNLKEKKCINCDRCQGNFECSQCTQHSQKDDTYRSLSIGACVFVVTMSLVGLGYVVYQKARPCISGLGRSESPGGPKMTEIDSEGAQSPHTLLPVQEEGLVRSSMLTPWSETRLPDCVQGARSSPLPHNTQVNYTIADLVPASRWREFVRRLGLNDTAIERTELDCRTSYREAQYQMFQLWRQRQGSEGATLEVVYQALRDMDLTVCAEQLQDRLR